MRLFNKMIVLVAAISIAVTLPACQKNDVEENQVALTGQVSNDTKEDKQDVQKSETNGIAEADDISKAKAAGASEEESDTAKDLNTQGYNLYKQAKYKEALELFKMSFEADDKFFLAHYNYACTLGVLMKQNYEEWYEKKKDIIEHLKKVKSLNPDYIGKIKSDPDLDLIRNEFEYYLIIGLSPDKTEDVESIIRSIKWHVRGQGVLSVVGGIRFKDNDTFELWFYDLSNFGGDMSEIKYTGKYKVSGNKITLTLNNEMLRKRTLEDIYDNFKEYDSSMTFNGMLTKDGAIEIDGFQYPFTFWYDEFSA